MSLPPCKTSTGKGQWKCYPRYKTFSSWGHGRRGLSRKRFGSSISGDDSQVIPWLSLSYGGAGGKRVGRSVIDERAFLSVGLMFMFSTCAW